jgi:hypothetical protein
VLDSGVKQQCRTAVSTAVSMGSLKWGWSEQLEYTLVKWVVGTSRVHSPHRSSQSTIISSRSRIPSAPPPAARRILAGSTRFSGFAGALPLPFAGDPSEADSSRPIPSCAGLFSAWRVEGPASASGEAAAVARTAWARARVGRDGVERALGDEEDGPPRETGMDDEDPVGLEGALRSDFESKVLGLDEDMVRGRRRVGEMERGFFSGIRFRVSSTRDDSGSSAGDWIEIWRPCSWSRVEVGRQEQCRNAGPGR